MDIDNINDIEVLRDVAKYGKLKTKCAIANHRGYIFNANEYYEALQYPDHIELLSDDFQTSISLSFRSAKQCLYWKG